jgi:PKD repeat protein
MKTGSFSLLTVLAFLMLVTLIETASGREITSPENKARVLNTFHEQPLAFTENLGQIDKRVKFYQRGSGHETYFTKNGIYFAFHQRKTKPVQPTEIMAEGSPMDESVESSIVRLMPAGVHEGAQIKPKERLKGKVNYYIGNKRARWKTNVPIYRSIVYQEAFPGIDLKFYGTDRQLEYDVTLKPGSDVSQVKFEYTGIESLAITDQGELSIKVKEGLFFKQKRPVVYQLIDGKRIECQASFKLQPPVSSPGEVFYPPETSNESAGNFSQAQGNNQPHVYGFEVSSYDSRHPLIIDPVIVYTTYLEVDTSGENYGLGLRVDAYGNAYVVGYTYTTNTSFLGYKPSSIMTAGGAYNVFVKKLNASGGDLSLYTTYLGGNADSYGLGIAIDSSRNTYITGYTSASDFPTDSPYQAKKSTSNDAFITKLSASGAISYSTYLGGAGRDFGQGIAVDASGNAYITGKTDSKDFPRKNAMDGTYNGGSSDTFITKLNNSGNTLVYSTYIGGNSDDSGECIIVDSAMNAYVAGWTYSTNFYVKDAYQKNHGGIMDAFISKLNPAGSALVYSTFLGSEGSDAAKGIALDSSESVYVVGETSSSTFPVKNAAQGLIGGNTDAFVTKLNNPGSELVYSTFLGGSGRDFGYSIALDESGNAYLTGKTSSTNFPTANAFRDTKDTYDAAFISELAAAGNVVVFSSYFIARKGNDAAKGIALDRFGNAYLAGYTEFNGTKSAFAAKIGTTIQPDITVISPDGGEAWETGSTRTISWSYAGNPGANVRIQLLKGSLVSSKIISSTPIGSSGYGSYTWNIPSDQQPGKDYRIRIISTANTAYKDTSDSYFSIAPPRPVANFTATPTTGISPLTVAFTDKSTNATKWLWNFGDGKTSTERNPEHVYRNRTDSTATHKVTLTVTGPGGSDAKSYADLITVAPEPLDANFIASPTNGPAPLDVSFTDKSMGNVTSLSWNFGDGTPSASAENPSHRYEEAGNYTVTLTAEGPSSSDTMTRTDYITVIPPPITVTAPNHNTVWPAGTQRTIRWTYTPDAEEDSVNIELFRGTSKVLTITPSPIPIGDAGSGYYVWDIPSELLSGDIYTIWITSTTHPLYKDRNYGTFDISACTTDFEAAPTSGMAPLTVSFTDKSTGAITSWSWDFGDGETSTLQNPDHIYNIVGTYTVKLTVLNENGYSTRIKTDHIVAAGITVTAPNDASSWPAGSTQMIRWRYEGAPGTTVNLVLFKDGSALSPIATRRSIGTKGRGAYAWTIPYNEAPGTDYSIKITSGGGYTDFSDGLFTITEPTPAANFAATPRNGSAPLSVRFFDTSTGGVTSRSWNFGDEGASTLQKPTHTYAEPGTYTVQLTVVGPGGSDTIVKKDFIVIDEYAPVADFTATPTTGVAPLVVQFTDASTGTITDRLWDFGNGQTSTAVNPSYEYKEPGVYTVTLTINGPGGTDSKTRTNYITVGTPPPVADFTGTPVSGPAPLTVSFTDKSIGSVTSWLWNFGDGGETSTAENPVHTYNTPGAYTVTLTATGPGGTGTKTRTNYIQVNVPSPPVATFLASTTSGTAPLTVNFTDNSTGDITDWLWDFGDDTADSTEQNPSHVFAAPGTYTVTLTVSGYGRSDTASKTIEVNSPITVTLPNGGQSWSAGSRYTIKWTYTGNPGQYVKIHLYSGGVYAGTITSSTSIGSSGSGSYSWRIPSSTARGTSYKIKITSTSNGNLYDFSDNTFTIR